MSKRIHATSEVDSAAAAAASAAAKCAEPPFWAERAGWPFMHYAISMALQAARLLPLEYSFLIIYVHESIECAFSLRWPTHFRESRQDSVLGDILVGSLGITTMFVIDASLDSQESAQMVLPLWVRLATLAALYPTSFFFIRFNKLDNDTLQFGSLAYGVFYVLLVIVGTAVAASAAPHSVDGENVKLALRTAIWLVLIMVQTGNAALPHARFSIWQQVFFVGAALLFAMLLLGYFLNLARF
jgi:hypothetical protein